MKSEKYKKFLIECGKAHPQDYKLFESIYKGFNVCFESTDSPKVNTDLLDSPEADLLSKSLKLADLNTDASKRDLNKIYNTFIRMDKNKLNEPFDIVFGKIKQMLVHLETGATTDDIIKYIGQFV